MNFFTRLLGLTALAMMSNVSYAEQMVLEEVVVTATRRAETEHRSRPQWQPVQGKEAASDSALCIP